MPTKIEWTDETWNPIRARNKETGEVGHFCVHASPGCENCYAEGMQKRLFNNPVRYAAQDADKVEMFLDEKVLARPLSWKKPRTVFVCSMTDLFLENIPDEWIDKVFAVMAIKGQTTFQVLTKRADRMREYMKARAKSIKHWEPHARDMGYTFSYKPDGSKSLSLLQFPLQNVWLSVSAEDQKRANERIPELIETPAKIRGVSLEPLLGPINLHEGGMIHYLDWVIVGGESGPKARPMELAWAEDIVDQCREAGVPCFVKQLGSKPICPDGTQLYQRNRKGGDINEFPDWLRVREMPNVR